MYAPYCDEGYGQDDATDGSGGYAKGAYPLRIHTWLGRAVSWADVSCSGATSGVPSAMIDYGITTTNSDEELWPKDVVCPSNPSRDAHYFCELGINGQRPPLGTATKYVTITIGGNDLKFAGIAQSCVALQVHGAIPDTGTLLSFAETVNLYPAILNCDEYLLPAFRTLGYYNDSTAIIANPVPTSSELIASLVLTYEKIHVKAPNAKIYVLGYPSVLPKNYSDEPFCGFSDTLENSDPSVTPSDGDLYFIVNHLALGFDSYPLSRLEYVLDQEVARAAAIANVAIDSGQGSVKYVDIQDQGWDNPSDRSDSETLCYYNHGGIPDGEAWVQPPLLTSKWQSALVAAQSTAESDIETLASDALSCATGYIPACAYLVADAESAVAAIEDDFSGSAIVPGAGHPTPALYTDIANTLENYMKNPNL
jgi:hypothetical protein